MEAPIEIQLNAREQRYYDQLRGKVRTPAPGAQSDLRDLLLAFPDLVMMLFRLMRDERVPIGHRAIALLGIGYVLSPIDVLPTFLFGPFGVVDDLIVVAAVISRLVNHVHPDVVRSHWSGQGDVLDVIGRVADWSERNVSGRIRAMIGV
jgi:uncharacterized membrane protein YkvA (DUF1232 family)